MSTVKEFLDMISDMHRNKPRCDLKRDMITLLAKDQSPIRGIHKSFQSITVTD